jgi:chromosome segregation ATPase
LSPPPQPERERFVRESSQDPKSTSEPEKGRVGTRIQGGDLAKARARVAKLETALVEEREARKRDIANLRKSLRAAAAEREQLDRQLHLVWLQLDHAEEKLAWAQLPRWRRLLRRAPG